MPFKSEKQRKWMHANEPEMAKKWEKKEKKMKRVKELIKKMVREELAKMNEVRIPFSSSHIKQLKRAFKDMKGTLPDNNPLVQQIVTLLKKTDKKVLKQIASADIKYLSDKAKDILGEEKITEAMDSYVVWSPLLNKVYDGPVSEKEALKLIKKYAKQGQYHVGMLGTKYFNKTKLGKKNPVKEGTCGYGENGELGEEPAGPHLIKKKIKEGKLQQAQRQWKNLEDYLNPKQKKFIKKHLNSMKSKWKYFKAQDYADYIEGELDVKIPAKEIEGNKKAIAFGQLVTAYSGAIKEPKYYNEGKLNEAKETIFDVAARVMKDKQAYGYKTKKGLVTVDMQTANLLTQVFKKVNPKMKKILSDIGYKNPTGLMNTLWAAVK